PADLPRTIQRIAAGALEKKYGLRTCRNGGPGQGTGQAAPPMMRRGARPPPPRGGVIVPAAAASARRGQHGLGELAGRDQAVAQREEVLDLGPVYGTG